MSTKGTVEQLIRDKLSVVFIVLYLAYSVLFEIATLFELIRFLGLLVLAISIIYENHRHVEKLGNADKSKDLILDFKDHLNRELKRFEKIDEKAEESSEKDEIPDFLEYLFRAFQSAVLVPEVKPEPEIPDLEEIPEKEVP